VTHTATHCVWRWLALQDMMRLVEGMMGWSDKQEKMKAALSKTGAGSAAVCCRAAMRALADGWMSACPTRAAYARQCCCL
jgi:hypothetical protein